MATLIAHGTTPTGFGIRQRRNGALRPISKCCGRSMQNSSRPRATKCKGCGADYVADSHRLGASLGSDVTLDPTSVEIVRQWVENVTGHQNVSLDVTW